MFLSLWLREGKQRPALRPGGRGGSGCRQQPKCVVLEQSALLTAFFSVVHLSSTLALSKQCKWVVEDIEPPISGSDGRWSSKSSVSGSGADDDDDDGNGDVHGYAARRRPITVSYLTEQTSHHPPVSAFYIDCPEKGLSARGFDQLSAKFTGTSVRVTPGAYNLGIFITLHKRGDEEYNLTHPAAQLGGLLRGFSIPIFFLFFILFYSFFLLLPRCFVGHLSPLYTRLSGPVVPFSPVNTPSPPRLFCKPTVW